MKNRKLNLVLMLITATLFIASNTAHAKFKKVVKPDKSYDFKAVERVVIMPYTSKGVEYGKVDKKRLPKVKSILKNTGN